MAKTGNANLDKYSLTNESMTWKMAASYQAIGDELSIPVVHVGLAFYDLYSQVFYGERKRTQLKFPSANRGSLAHGAGRFRGHESKPMQGQTLV